MSPAVWSAIVTALGVVAVAVITTRQNRRGADATNALAERTVDREEFDSITRELRQTISDLRSELGNMRTELAGEVTARREADRRATEAERRADAAVRRADAAERRVDQLQRRIATQQLRIDQLERALGDRDITVPPPSGEQPDLD